MLWHQITMNEIRVYRSLFGKQIVGVRWLGEVAVMGETWTAENVLIGGKSR
jgi:hypothetical protein